MKTCLCTLLNDEFVVAYVAFVKSMLVNNPWFDLDFVIIDDDLSDESKDEIRKHYKNIIFRDIKKENYANVNYSKTFPQLHSAFFKLELFAMTEYDRIVFMDMDILVLGNIRELFDASDGFVGVKQYREVADLMINEINSGVFVVNKKFINGETYRGLLKVSESMGHKLADQSVLNHYFNGKIAYANKSYNCEKRITKSRRYAKFQDVKNIKVLHFVGPGQKPWQEKSGRIKMEYQDLEEIWWSWYQRVM